ncbi:hypothetical protein N9F11_00330 [Akkermansiaceae bacterium]|nr:hypothetical protein [Akkermansiaceae bacterium]
MHKKNHKAVEFIFGTTHQKISSQLKLLDTDKFRFNIYDNKLGFKDIISDSRLLFIATIYGLEAAVLLTKSVGQMRIRRDSLRLVKNLALAKFAKFHLKEYNVLIQYNDHSPYNVMLQELAKQLGLKTVYIQHAPVSRRFPPLYHDLNVLFSNDSLEKYRFTTGEDFNKHNYLIFYDVRFPPKENLDSGKSDYTLLCFNKLDDLAEIHKVLAALTERGIEVKLRPHPEDYRTLSFDDHIKISTGNTIWEDLAGAHSVIVNESAVPLEALYCSVPVYKLSSLSVSIRDNYGFLETGLLEKEYFSIEELLGDLLNKKNVSNLQKLDFFLGNLDKREELKRKLDIEIKMLQNNIE